jgi:outer membrane receptor protein involved in Fe transport
MSKPLFATHCNLQPGSISRLQTTLMIVLLLTVSAPTIFAQQTAAGTGESVLEEVLVTAAKRDVNLQDIGMSVSVLNGDDLRNLNAILVEEFIPSLPNVSFGFGGGGDGRNARSFAIRGISGTNTTGFYLDETPVPNFVEPRLVDVARVEVLRGPQGTLYGASNMGGTIRLISNKPDYTQFTSLADVTLSDTREGDFNYLLQGVLNTPLVEDRFGMRIVAFIEDEDGVFDRVYPDSSQASGFGTTKNVDSTQSEGVAVSFGFAATDRLSMLARINYQKIESDGASWASELGSYEQNRMFDIPELLEDEWVHSTLTIDYAGNHGTFVSASSYFDRDYLENEDISEIIRLFFGGFEFPTEIDQVEEYQSFTQEFRYVSSLEGPFQFIAGAWYSDIDRNAPSTSHPPGFEAAFAEFVGAPGAPVFGGSDLVFGGQAEISLKEKALFGEASYAVTDQWTVTVGMRWFNADVHRFTLDEGIVADGSLTIGDTDDSGVNPKVLVDFDLNENVHLYGSATKGYRNGGVSGFIPEFCGADVAAPSTPYDSDSLWSYELGAKTRLGSNSTSLNGAVFQIDWDDIQQVRAYPCGFAQIINAGKARSRGFEMELNTLVTDKLELSFGLGYADAQIRSSIPGITPQSGDRLLQVPEWTGSAAATYTFMVPFADSAYFHTNYSYTGDSVTKFPGDPSYTAESAERDAYSLWNVRLGMRQARWDAALFVTNLFDEVANLSEVRSLAAEAPGLERYAINRPRTIGVQARMFWE